MGQTFIEKILAKKAGLRETVPGQIVEIKPEVALSHDNTAAIQNIFKKMGGTKVLDPEMRVIVLDHATPAPTTTHAENHRIIREFVSEQGIENFFDVGRGICHQVVENRMPCRQGQALRLLADERGGEKNWSLRIKKN